MDYISREDALKWCRPEEWGTPDERWRPESEFGEMIKALPPQKPKRGRWEFIGGYGYQYRCSECITCAGRKTKFCPNCGARMDGEL